uniref:Ribosomal protein S14 n=1 Tax=Prasinococcus sp. CCMP1194 TaxID=110672 RepID=A0A650AKM8_9VIRI|nr:ribosomal protein S14 [Prasinococcus sp. CCMP1194]
MSSPLQRDMIRRHRASTQEPSRILLKALARKGHPNERFRAFLDLSKKPTDGSFVRVRKRCSLTGRSRGLVHRSIPFSRILFKKRASQGLLPMVKKL